MFTAPASNFLVPYDGSFRVDDAPTAPAVDDKKKLRKRLKAANRRLDTLQQVLMAGDNHAELLVFQAMDAAG